MRRLHSDVRGLHVQHDQRKQAEEAQDGGRCRDNAVLGNVVDGAGGALLGVAATTFALKAAAGSQRRGAVYGAFLAAYDGGGAASGWLAAFLATKCRTEPDDSESVRRYLYVASTIALAPLAHPRETCARTWRNTMSF